MTPPESSHLEYGLLPIREVRVHNATVQSLPGEETP